MLKTKSYQWYVAAIIFCVCTVFAAPSQAAQFKVLVVMSYDETYPWVQEIKESIDSTLKSTCEIRYFYMNMKSDIAGGEQKAKEAYALYQEFKPDGVIAADDEAQSLFVLPYLKDKVKTPVMFCGANATAEKYGYPASNVSGILERLHISEGIALAQQLVPSIKTVGYMVRDGAVAKVISEQVESEKDTYSAKTVAFKMLKTKKEAIAVAEELSKQCDLLYFVALQGIADENGKALTDKEATKIVLKAFGKPTITSGDYDVKYGALCGLRHTGTEQGETSANMLLKAMQGTPVSQIPITRNKHGKAMINVKVMKALEIKPDPRVLYSAELVKTEE
jgi:ABC-type uncharacterized transport system substrate-binding protein